MIDEGNRAETERSTSAGALWGASNIDLTAIGLLGRGRRGVAAKPQKHSRSTLVASLCVISSVDETELTMHFLKFVVECLLEVRVKFLFLFTMSETQKS